MLKPHTKSDFFSNSLCAAIRDSDLVHALRTIAPRAGWWIAPAVIVAAGFAGWIATIPLN
jgi:hypothetical protein